MHLTSTSKNELKWSKNKLTKFIWFQKKIGTCSKLKDFPKVVGNFIISTFPCNKRTKITCCHLIVLVAILISISVCRPIRNNWRRHSSWRSGQPFVLAVLISETSFEFFGAFGQKRWSLFFSHHFWILSKKIVVVYFY